MSERIFIGVAWPYANGPLHIGHLAGAYLPADIFARYHRLRGNEVLMVSGSDCFGTPISVRADQDDTTPEAVADRFHQEFLGYWDAFGISFDLYTRTLDPVHIETVQRFWLQLQENGYVVEGVSVLPYDPERKQFLPDRYVEGTCPICGYTDARGDQCDNCGNTLDPEQLIAPRSKLSGATPEMREARHLFFTLSAFQDRLQAWIEPQEDWRRNVKNTSLAWLRDGLHDRSVTRDLEWGIPAPFEGFEEKKIYVWFDAVVGYLSASIQWARMQGDDEAWKPFWADPSTRSFYFLGKDNVPFHTIIWPSMLMGHGELNLPSDVPANQYVTISGDKASKSRGTGVFLADYLEAWDPEPLRFVLARIMPETSDADFTWDDFVRRNNDELVATWGNLVNRVLSFTYRNFDGKVPANSGTDERSDRLLVLSQQTLQIAADHLEARSFRRALEAALSLAQEANRYLDEKAPWKAIKSDRQSAASSLATAIAIIDALKVMLWPFLPASCERLDVMLGYDGDVLGRGWKSAPVPAGQILGEPAPLYRKLELAEATARV